MESANDSINKNDLVRSSVDIPKDCKCRWDEEKQAGLFLGWALRGINRECPLHGIKKPPLQDLINEWHEEVRAASPRWHGEKKEITEYLEAFIETYSYNREFATLLNDMARTHIKKNRDYATDDNRYSNFEYAHQLAAPFTGVDQVFATMLGIKLARIAELRKGKVPNFESIEDSFKDLAVYTALWGSYNMMRGKESEKKNVQE